MIRLSIIIPCYNHGIFLLQAIESIRGINYRDQIEVIIINDGSSDEHTISLLSRLDKSMYRVFSQKNSGLAKSRNLGIRMAVSPYVLMLDADNYIESEFISDFFSLVSRKVDFDALYGNAKCFGLRSNMITPGDFDLLRLMKGNYIDACAIFKKKTIEDLGYYDEGMPYMGWEDWDLWLRLGFVNARVIYRNRLYYHYRVVEGSMIRSHDDDHVRETFKYIYKKHAININNIERVIENYINSSFPFLALLKLLLKKLRVFKKYRYNV